MDLLVIQVFFLLSSNWLTAEVVAEFDTEEFFTHIRNITSENLVNRSIEYVIDEEMFLSQNIERFSLVIIANLNHVRTMNVQYGYDEDISNKLQFVETSIDSIRASFSNIFQQPYEVSKIAMNNITMFLGNIHSSMTKYQPELANDLLTWIGRQGIIHPYVFCERKTSSYIIVHNIVNNLMILDSVINAAMKFYYSRYSNSLENSTLFLESSFEVMLLRYQSYIEIASSLMTNTENVIYSCDAEKYIRDESYIELEGLLQPVFITASRIESCEAANFFSNIPGCNKLTITSAHMECDSKPVDALVSSRNETSCYGHLSDCVPMRSREVCRNYIYAQPNTLRRYSWYKIDGEVFGEEDSCPNGIKEEFESLKNPTGSIHHCYCTCHDNGPESPTTHVLNLAWSISDTEKNKVVTGIKFTRVGKMILLQIKQGILISEVRILSGSENWKSVSNEGPFRLNNKRDDSYRNFNFVVLDENTIFDLDDVIASSRYAVTGVRFYQLENQRIKLLVRQTKFNWRTGLLNEDFTNRDINPNPNRYELLVPLINPALHQPQIPNMPDSRSKSDYVKLKESARKSDGGSTMLPFFDAQKVEMKPSTPVRGIGLYHRGSSESAGFISLRLIGLDYGN